MSNAVTSPKLAAMNYRVVGPLGNGAGSTILQISDKTAGGKRYALKVVRRLGPDDDVYLNQAKVEYDVSQKLQHPAIVRIYDIRQKRSWFRVAGVELLMEYVDGKTLDEIEAPEMGQLVLVFCQVASALSHMHRRGVFHGDLKPSNVMLSKAGEVKLIDFGTARVRGEEKNRVQGTPQYIAPEQVADKVVNAKTDIYNFGATMYRMFTGRFANHGIPKAEDAANRKLAEPGLINPKIPAPLNALILSCLAYDPDARPEAMLEVQKGLSAVAKSLGLKEVDLKGANEEGRCMSGGSRDPWTIPKSSGGRGSLANPCHTGSYSASRRAERSGARPGRTCGGAPASSTMIPGPSAGGRRGPGRSGGTSTRNATRWQGAHAVQPREPVDRAGRPNRPAGSR